MSVIAICIYDIWKRIQNKIAIIGRIFLKKAIFAGVIALGMLSGSLAFSSKPADAAVSYAKYTVSPKVRGNWKLKLQA